MLLSTASGLLYLFVVARGVWVRVSEGMTSRRSLIQPHSPARPGRISRRHLDLRLALPVRGESQGR